MRSLVLLTYLFSVMSAFLFSISSSAEDIKPPVEISPERDAVVIYLRELNYYMPRMATKCRIVLRMPEIGVEGEPDINRWSYTNYKYTKAAAIYDGNQGPKDALVRFQYSIEVHRVAQSNGYAKADKELKSAKDKKQFCTDYFEKLSSGKYDITPEDAHYEVLEKMVNDLVR